MRRRVAYLLMCASGCSAAPAVASASGSHWRPVRLAREVVKANLKKAAPRFPVFVGTTTCAGRVTVAHCTVKGSVSNDNVSAKVSFTRQRDGSHIKYRDVLTFVAAMGGGTVTRTYYGNIIT